MEVVTSIAANAAHTRVCQPNLLRRLKWIVLLSVCMIGSPHLTPAYQQQRDDHVLHCSSPRVGTDIEDYFSCADLVVSVQNCSLSRKECGVWSELIGVLLMRLGKGPYCAELVAAAAAAADADTDEDVVATLGSMTTVGDDAESGVRTLLRWR
jgi:hypothetical protein